MLNLKYYLIDLSELEEEYILNTNTVIDNIMYCDKYRAHSEIITALQTAYRRINTLNDQDIESFDVWAHNILLSVCKDKTAVAEELLTLVKKGDNNMGDFKHGWLLQYEEDQAKAVEKGLEQGILALIETCKEFGASYEDTCKRLIDKFSLNKIAARWPAKAVVQLFFSIIK